MSDRAEALKQAIEELEDRFPDLGVIVLLFDVGVEGTAHIIANVSQQEAISEMENMVESLKEEHPHGNTH